MSDKFVIVITFLLVSALAFYIGFLASVKYSSKVEVCTLLIPAGDFQITEPIDFSKLSAFEEVCPTGIYIEGVSKLQTKIIDRTKIPLFIN